MMERATTIKPMPNTHPTTSVLDFFKRSSYIESNKRSLSNLVSHINNLASVEGLTAHALSANIRFLKRD